MKDLQGLSYIPILSVSPAEMVAIEQLPDKDKDLLLPLFPLKGWVASHRLENTLKRIKQSIGNRPFIADIDEKFLSENKVFLFTGEHPDIPIYGELKNLLTPQNGFYNWCKFIEENDNFIPCLRHESLVEIDEQIARLSELDRGIVVRITPNENNISKHSSIIRSLANAKAGKILVIYDLETIDINFEERIPLLERFMQEAKSNIQGVTLSVSSSSFPSGFARQEEGENSIYERLLFNRLEAKDVYAPLIFSDRGSARAQKQDGGAGTPPPRIDYPMKKDWKFVRREIEDNAPNARERRRVAYVEIAQEIIKAEYWTPELRLWGTQQIELTAGSDEFGIYSPQKSTAARINIHLFVQLHYNQETTEVDTDEEWVD